MATTVDQPASVHLGEFNDLPVLADAVIPEDSLVGITAAGFAHPLDGANDAAFAGHAVKRADATGKSNGDIRVKVRRGIYYKEVSLSGGAQANAGDGLFASDNNTYSLVDDATTIRVGTVSDLVATDKVMAKFESDV